MSNEEEHPLGGYAALTGAFAALLGGALYAGRRRLPDHFRATDLALAAVGTHKISRTISKDKVTSTFRRPFVEHQSASDAPPGEVDEKPKGDGLRRAIGELLTCPYCIGQWVAAGFLTGFLFVPRVTRAIAALFTVKALADLMHLGFRAAEDKA